jgi:replicative DNA helicase
LTTTEAGPNGQTTAPSPPDVGAPRLARLGDLLGDWRAFAEDAHNAYTTGRARGPRTGLVSLDRELGGVLEAGVHILHGQPGTGKTAFALQVAAECGFPALYVTAEMAPLELLRRVIARLTGTFLGRLKSGELPPDEAMRLARQSVAKVPYLALADATLAYTSPDWIRVHAELVRGDAPHVLIVVDSVHSWAEGNADQATEYDGLNLALAYLRALSATLSCPILAVAERNRASMGKGGLNAGAGTRKLEYGATSVLDLSREDDAREDAAGEVPVALKLAKNRNGPAGKRVNLKFHGARQAFREDR